MSSWPAPKVPASTRASAAPSPAVTSYTTLQLTPGVPPLAVLQTLKKQGVSDTNIQEIIKMVDKDNSGTIDYQEFVHMMRSM